MDVYWNSEIFGIVVDNLLILCGAVAAGLVLHALAFWTLERVVRSTKSTWDDLLPTHLKSPSRLLVLGLAIQIGHPLMRLPASVSSVLAQALSILTIVGSAWLLIRGTHLFRDVLLLKFDMAAQDNLRSRTVQTQVRVFQNVVIAIIAIIAVAMVLTTFQGIRQVGVSLLASAGIAGIVVGFAAQKTLGNLIAGLQLAITQPIRLDDVVIVEGEWGRIEEITLTYIVVKIWDLRRLVVPISHFIEKPFQNWTRTGSDILGTVFLHCDPTADMDVLRSEMDRIVKPSPLWDGKVCGLQITDARPDSIEVRLLVSTADSSKGWDLRCMLREAMLAFLRDVHPEWLARRRLLHDHPAHGAERLAPG